MTLMVQDSKPIIEQLEEISKLASKFESLQKRGAVPIRDSQEILS